MHYWKKAQGAVEGNSDESDQNGLDHEPAGPKPTNVPSVAAATAVAAAGAPGNRSKPARLVKYTEEEYRKAVEPMISDWDRLETDVLFELCERFDLRFIVIADRFSLKL